LEEETNKKARVHPPKRDINEDEMFFFKKNNEDKIA